MLAGEILSVQVGLPKVYQSASDDGEDRTWSSGIFKRAVEGPVHLGETNLDGDGQADLVHHGGPDRALLLYSAAHYPFWEDRFGHSLEFGSFGENLTITDMDELQVCLGDRFTIGEVEIEVSQPRLPCFKLARRLDKPGLNLEVMENRRGGWYTRTLKSGSIQRGDRLQQTAQPNPQWTIDRCFATFISEKKDRDVLAELAALPQLSELWRTNLQRRLAQLG
ncbi:MAG: MOSC domain-containing protein [Armatimonadetes bacterium]|nr:MOSC domain-containing protein [Armatimonadota bacterium]